MKRILFGFLILSMLAALTARPAQGNKAKPGSSCVDRLKELPYFHSTIFDTSSCVIPQKNKEDTNEQSARSPGKRQGFHPPDH